MELASNWIQ